MINTTDEKIFRFIRRSPEVTAISFLIVLFGMIDAKPQPDVIRERLVIHAPIKFKTIHHHRIQKVPVIIKKHLFYHKKEAKPAVEEDDANYIPHHRPDAHDLYFHRQEYFNREIPLHRPSFHEDNEDFQQSEEAESEDYEYE